MRWEKVGDDERVDVFMFSHKRNGVVSKLFMQRHNQHACIVGL